MRVFRRRRERGQSLVEFAVVIPVLLTLVLVIAEFGVLFSTNMSMVEATSAGSRVGAILVNGSNSLGSCGLTGYQNVDPQIMLTVQRVVESPGSGINPAYIDWVDIYDSTSTGGEGAYNRWTYKAGGGGTVCGVTLDFILKSTNWLASSRGNTLPVDSIGVLIQYEYHLFTPISAVTHLFGAGTITVVDSTVAAFEP